MFQLKELPEKKTIKKLAKDFNSIDPTSAHFSLQFLKTASDALVCIDKFFSSKGLSHGRFLALMVLSDSETGSLFPYEIADFMGVSRATASGLIKGLENSGAVQSVQPKTDGRMKKITLTSEGRELIDALIPEYYAFISKFTGSTDKKTLKQTAVLLSDFSESIRNID